VLLGDGVSFDLDPVSGDGETDALWVRVRVLVGPRLIVDDGDTVLIDPLELGVLPEALALLEEEPDSLSETV